MILDNQFDYCLIGGGLQAGLIALALAKHQPNASLLLIEKNSRLGGNHTWSCHQTDIPKSCESWFSSIPATKWPRYLVRINGYQRVVDIGYQSIYSGDFSQHINRLFETSSQSTLLLETSGTPIDKNRVLLEPNSNAGTEIRAKCILDCRGPEVRQGGSSSVGGRGYQKFFGWEVELNKDWREEIPIVMDVGSPQEDGFRFTYVLPFSSRRILLQDTWFSNHPKCDVQAGSEQLRDYLAKHGYNHFKIVREEHGCLPMPYIVSPTDKQLAIAVGYRGGLFHAATGYSMPLAVRVAETIARAPASEAHRAVAQLKKQNRFQSCFARFLNRMLFRLVKPQARHQIFDRFYRTLPESVISRFYSHTFSQLDAMRLVAGRPPSGLTPIQFLKSYGAER